MSSVHWLDPGEQYDYRRVYTEQKNRQVRTPEQLMRWLNIRTFGVLDTVAFWKKPISFYILVPDHLHGWGTGPNDGNPTNCSKVNDFVNKYHRKLEGMKQGAESEMRRSMEEREFRGLHEIFKTCGGPHSSGIRKLGMLALINFQFHLLIARIDNTTQIIMDNICVNDHFENAWKLGLNWSKNEQGERDAPWQIVLGCMNPIFCVFISLGLLVA